MLDFKLRALVPDYPFTLLSMQTACCQEVMENFIQGINRANSPVQLAVLYGMIFKINTEALSAASCDIFGKVYSIDEEIPESSRWIEEGRSRLMEGVQRLVKRGMEAYETEIAGSMDSAAVLGPSPKISAVNVSVLNAIVTLSWTVLEVLIEDLHTQCISLHRSAFKQEVRNKFDAGNFQFRSRRRFKEGYGLAFDYCPAIDAIMIHEDLLALALVRNVIVHKSGVVDAEFMGAGLRDAPRLSRLNPTQGNPLLLDGEVIKDLQFAAFEKGFELIQEVDRWLKGKRV